jgi:hypothetical protein
LPPGGCLQLINQDRSAYRLTRPVDEAVLAPEGVGVYCFAEAGVNRVQLNEKPYSGGFVVVDPAMEEL